MAYIDREKLIEQLEDDLKFFGQPDINAKPISYGGMHEILRVLSFVKKTPAADVEEVRHGEWLECSNELNKYCSVCEKVEGTIYEKPPFCKNCGAKMDGGKNENLL